MRLFRLALVLAAILGGIAGVSRASPQSVIADLASQDAQAIEWRGVTIDLNKLLPVYTRAGMAPVFVSGSKLTPTGTSLVVALGKAREDGLEPKDYIEVAFGALNRLQGDEDAAGAELALAQSFLRYARDLHSGRATPALNVTDIIVKMKEVDPAKWLDMVRTKGLDQTITALRPHHPQYEKMRKMLANYRKYQALGGWPEIAAGPSLKPGMTDPRVADLRASLALRGYKALSGGQPDNYDPKLLDAVKRFQRASGIDADGVVGKGTLKFLNVPVEKRMRQIIVNMERWRWLPADLGRRHIFVNQAGFELFLTDGDQVVDQRRVIVGKPFHKTPMFSDLMRYVEFNPTWTVTDSIAAAEFLPKLKEDPGYLAANDYKIYAGWKETDPEIDPYSVDWNNLRPGKFPYRIVQQPGDKNALGYVKFMFPNKQNIYLHDTPSRQLFASTGRAFSHGCIRVSNAMDFAQKLLMLDQQMAPDDVQARVDTGILNRVSLKNKIPVHLAYFTVWIEEDGVVNFLDDLYERDRLVEQILFG